MDGGLIDTSLDTWKRLFTEAVSYTHLTLPTKA